MLVRAALNCRGDASGRPALVFLEQGQRELIWVLHPHAAMTLGAYRLGEQRFLRRVVHVHVVLVGEDEFQISQHVVWPWRLVDVEAANIDPVPVDPGWVDLAAADIDAQIVALEHCGVPAAAAERYTLLYD